MRQGMIVSAAVVLAAVVVLIAVNVAAQEWGPAPTTMATAVAVVPPAAIADAKLTAALEAVEAIRKALDDGDTEGVRAALEEVESYVVEAQGFLVAARFANTRCPITGLPIDPVNVPESLTRLYRGQVVAFSSERSVTLWDAMPPAERDSRLATASGAEVLPEVGSKIINVVCPIDGRHVDSVGVPPSLIRMHRGRSVGFDNRDCRRKWDRLSMAERDTKLEQALSNPGKVVNTICPIDGWRVDPISVPPSLIRMWRGRAVGLDKWDCRRRWDALSPAEKDAKLEAVAPEGGSKAPRAPAPQGRY